MWEMVKGLRPVTASSSVWRRSLKRQILSFGDGSCIGVPCRDATPSVRKKNNSDPNRKRLDYILNAIAGQPEAFSAAMNTCSAALMSLVVETFTRAHCHGNELHVICFDYRSRGCWNISSYEPTSCYDRYFTFFYTSAFLISGCLEKALLLVHRQSKTFQVSRNRMIGRIVNCSCTPRTWSVPQLLIKNHDK